jgi:methanogenic corrinoid protein MtbC1
MYRELIDAFVGMKEKEALEIAKGLLESGADPLKILNACKQAMITVGKRFEAGEFFLPELVLAGEILRLRWSDRVRSSSEPWRVISMISARILSFLCWM